MSTGIPARVLVIEDERDLAQLMASILEDEGYEVATCLDGDCFDIVRWFKPDVILCDYMLPVHDGQYVVREIKQKVAPEVPIIMVSAISRAMQGWRHWGATDFVAKPFDITRLITAVERAVGKDAHHWTRGGDLSLEGEQAS